MTSAHSGATACDPAIALPDLILRNLGREGVEEERLFANSLTRLNTVGIRHWNTG